MFSRLQKEGVVYFASSLLPCPHGFSTRLGGVSTLPYLASMNFALPGGKEGDDPRNVEENFRRFTAALSLPGRVILAKQVRGSRVLPVGREEMAALSTPISQRTLPEADGFVTAERDVTLCVKTADCLPLLLCEKEAGVTAALHAGWQGSAQGIALRGVEAMARLGARREKILCAIGPSIHACCFEVKEDFVRTFRQMLGEDLANRFLLYRRERRDGREALRIFADLQGLNRTLLLEAGLLPTHIEISPACTCCAPEGLFFSHRASGGRRGLMAGMISLGGEAENS